jgi:hypothetical protein
MGGFDSWGTFLLDTYYVSVCINHEIYLTLVVRKTQNHGVVWSTDSGFTVSAFISGHLSKN